MSVFVIKGSHMTMLLYPNMQHMLYYTVIYTYDIYIYIYICHMYILLYNIAYVAY